MNKIPNNEIVFEDFELYVNPRMINGAPAIILTKVITICDKNKNQLDNLIKIVMTDSPNKPHTKFNLLVHDRERFLLMLKQLGVNINEIKK